MFEAETQGVRIRVHPEYLEGESDPEQHQFVWAYTVEIENHSDDAVKLLSRYWKITDAKGITQEVRGEGVIGQQPVISPGGRFEYTSAAPLAAPSGLMLGAYRFRRTDGVIFEAAIPAFALDSPHSAPLAN